MVITKREAKAFLKTYDLIQEYIREVVSIAEASPVGLTDESRKIDRKLQDMYGSASFMSFKEKVRDIADLQ